MNKLFILILITSSFLGHSQVVCDSKLWTGISISKKVNDFEFSLAKDLKVDEKMTHLNEAFSEVGVQYKIVKGIYAGANYRINKKK